MSHVQRVQWLDAPDSSVLRIRTQSQLRLQLLWNGQNGSKVPLGSTRGIRRRGQWHDKGHTTSHDCCSHSASSLFFPLAEDIQVNNNQVLPGQDSMSESGQMGIQGPSDKLKTHASSLSHCGIEVAEGGNVLYAHCLAVLQRGWR